MLSLPLLLLLLLQDGQEFLKLLLTKLEHTFASSAQQVGVPGQYVYSRTEGAPLLWLYMCMCAAALAGTPRSCNLRTALRPTNHLDFCS